MTLCLIFSSCNDANGIVVVLDAGHLVVESQLADKDVLQEIKNGDIDDTKRLENLLYDRFKINMSSVQV